MVFFESDVGGAGTARRPRRVLPSRLPVGGWRLAAAINTCYYLLHEGVQLRIVCIVLVLELELNLELGRRRRGRRRRV